MKVLLSGSHGLIGRALAERLCDGGHTVVRMVRPGGTASGACVGWDPRRGSVDERAVGRLGPYGAVVHLAGAGIGDRRWTAARRREILASRQGPTRLLAELVTRLDPVPAVLACASAVGYYGDRGDEVLTEESPPGSGFLAEVCGAWEAAAAPASHLTRVAHLRTGIVLDRRGGALAKQLPLFRLGLGGRLGDGNQYMSWIALDDEVSAIVRVIEDDRLAGPLNLCAPSPVTNADFARALGRALRRPVALGVPRSVLSVALGAEMARELLLFSQRALPARLLAAGHAFCHPDIDDALAAALSAG